jgi:hypothetical protein
MPGWVGLGTSSLSVAASPALPYLETEGFMMDDPIFTLKLRVHSTIPMQTAPSIGGKIAVYGDGKDNLKWTDEI